ncbi:MAG TPA: Xaa-Pro peptidase family protein, partial [Vicinamibacteria bacterium]
MNGIHVPRRELFRVSAAAAIGAALPARALALAEEPPPSIAALQPRTEGIAPISLDERRARLQRAQALLRASGLDALVMATGSSLEYFTGALWGLSERFFGAVVTREGDPAWVTPAFEKERALEQIKLGADVRAWEEEQSPSELVAAILRDRKVATGRVGVDEAMPFAFADAMAKAAPTARFESGTPVTAGCRMVKDAHEIAILRRICEITMQAHRAVFAALREGMTQEQAAALCVQAHRQLGVRGGALVLFGKDAAFPHGTTRPQPLKPGDVVLVDGGGELFGYASDISRTLVFGAPPTDRQRQVWDLVRHAQDAAFRAVKPGVECQAVDAAARKVLEDGGFGPGYRYLTHRLGHGIGLDGHEYPYMVRGNRTRLAPGMCFSNEPGIYVYGEL